MTGKYVDMGKEIHFSFQGKMHTVRKAKNPGFENVRKALEAGNFEEAVKLAKQDTVETGNLKVKGNTITIKGTEIKLGSVYVDAFLYAKSMGKVSEDLFEQFFVNVGKNPDPVARDGLSDFMAHGRLPITDRGTFLTYRRVNHNFRDPHTNTMDNMIGNVVSMPRDACDSNPNASCSRGLHVCHHDYSDVMGPYTLVVEVRPQDVVAVPSRYDAKKMRTCAFRPLCTLDYFKRMLLLREQAALGMVPVFMTEQTRTWDPTYGVPVEFVRDRYKPVDPWKWAKGS
jgi:hypothetical protein